MSATSRISRCFGIALVILAVTGSCGHASADQQQAAAATARLKALSESPEAPDLGEIRRLIKAGADVNVRNKFGVTPLIMALQNGHAVVVKLLLAAEADVNAALKTNGVTPLFMASLQGHSKVVKLLLAAGADVNAKTNRGDTPLSIAKMRGHTRVVKFLKEHGAKE